MALQIVRLSIRPLTIDIIIHIDNNFLLKSTIANFTFVDGYDDMDFYTSDQVRRVQ